MLISQLETNKFEYFNSIEDSRKRNSQIGAVKYIKTLASLSQTDISHWNIVGLFSSESGILTDRGAINKIFFKYREDAPSNPTTMTEENFRKLGVIQSSRSRSSCDRTERELQNELNRSKENYGYFLENLKRANKVARRLQVMRNYHPNYTLEVDILQKAGFWSLKEITNDGVMFNTINPIILTHVDERYGVQRTVNLGRFTVYYNMMDSSVFVYNLEDNLYEDGTYVHPHVSGNRICFGELQPDALAFMASGNILATMDIVQVALTAYNDSSAYRSLSEFEATRNQITKNGENNNNTPPIDEDNIDEDEHDQEEGDPYDRE